MLTPFDLLERLVGVIPPPRKNQIRYHGFLAPNSHEREEIIAKRAEENHHKADKKIRTRLRASHGPSVFNRHPRMSALQITDAINFLRERSKIGTRHFAISEDVDGPTGQLRAV